MRRLPSSEAKPGMVLARPLTDAFHNLVLDEQQALTEDVLSRLPIYAVDELFIDDDRVADIAIEPLVEPHAEAQITQGLQTLYSECHGAGALDDSILELITRPIHEMAGEFFPVGLAELNTAPCASPADHLFRLPARAAGMAMLLAAVSGMDQEQTAEVGVATALMNAGFLSLPKEFVHSTGPLTSAQDHELRKHPVHGYVLLKDSKRVSTEIATAVLQSHELLDGSGYPRGISRDEISKISRIVTVADTYFTMISPFNRGARSSRHDTIEYMMAFGGELFDQELVQLLTRKVPVYPSGVMVGLNTLEIGIVIEPNAGHPGRPKIRVLKDKDGFEVKPGEMVEIDLADPRNRQRVVLEYQAA